ncbi:MAG TPA: PorP/SprF family type IX secretion system membrane protein [Chitinophagaceae bacterium]
MKRTVLLILISTLFLEVSAQDPHFSQFYASPLTLNPAFAGKFDGNVRVAGIHRNQWPTIPRAYITTSAAVDFRIMQGSIAENDTWGVGIMGFSDQSANGAVRFNYASAGTAFHKGLDEEGYHQIGAAFQVTYANMMINVSNLKFLDQLTPYGFTGTTSEMFNNGNLKSHYVDFNAGVLYNGSTTDQNNFYFGVSMYHINRPQQSFTGSYFILNPRTSIHAGGYFPAGQSGTVHLTGLYSTQGKASEALIGGAYQIRVNEDAYKPTSVYAGTWMRVNDAFIPYVGLEFGSFRLGASYDINISDLKTASNSRGGMEISLIYIQKNPEEKGINCPKF